MALCAQQSGVLAGKERTRPSVVERGDIERSGGVTGLTPHAKFPLVHIRVTGDAICAQAAEIHGRR